jgi:molybdopterin molybdotransferase
MERDFNEIDEGLSYVGYQEAFDLIRSNVKPVGTEKLSLDACAGRVVADDLAAALSYPSGDVSLKDGFAIKSGDLTLASRDNPVRLRVTGSVFAGDKFEGEVVSGVAVKICSGASIPAGAEAVVSIEFCEEVSADEVIVRADAGLGRNILRAGGEIKSGSIIVKKGGRLTPGSLGMAAAAGINEVNIYRIPRIAIIGVGDEVVAPGGTLQTGQLYASNLVTMGAWLTYFNIPYDTSVVKDDIEDIKNVLLSHIGVCDSIITSGGAWGSERDLVVGVLEKLGWQQLFCHARLGPGKGIAFGLWKDKPVFCLPGGPASNDMAFLQLALPGILQMGGEIRHPLQTVSAKLLEDVIGRHIAWTDFKDAVLSCDADGRYEVKLYRNRSRLQAIADATCLVCVPEGRESLAAGEIVPVQLLLAHYT